MTATGSLTGAVAAVTGGAGGIGQAIVGRLSAAGAHVVSLDLIDFDGAGVDSVRCDLRKEESVREAFIEIDRLFSRLDIVVHSAGVSHDAVVWKMTADAWDFVHSVNLRGAFLVLRESVPLMRRSGGGRVVLVGSINGSRGKRGTSAYSASKAGLIGLAKSVSREVAAFDILVNVVEPGWVRTTMTESLPAQLREAAMAETLLGELVEPDDVAEMVAFLCGPGSRRITGQLFRVDAGQLLGSG